MVCEYISGLASVLLKRSNVVQERLNMSAVLQSDLVFEVMRQISDDKADRVRGPECILLGFLCCCACLLCGQSLLFES